MQEVSPKICSAAVMIWCTASDQTCKCTIAKYSESASSYRGKILGAIITQLILGAAVTRQMGPYPIMTEDCDNNGVILHGNKHYQQLSSLQTQSNVLHVMKQLITHQPFVIKFLYVQSHSDDIKEWSACTIKELMNIKVDHLAKWHYSTHTQPTNSSMASFPSMILSFLWMDKRSLDLSRLL
jgi:hypothetical protein